MDNEKVHSVAARLNCKVDQVPIKYLGLPLGGYPRRYPFGNWPLINFEANWINGEDIIYLEKGEPLFANQFSNLPTYYMSSFLMAENVI